jgi:succinoglycan biosynthesis protein ExoV
MCQNSKRYQESELKMKMIYFQGKQPNFGDELNTWLWPQILPNFFDDDDSTVFLGIGSIISKCFDYNYEDAKKKIVFGAGYVSEYHEKPDVNQGDWDIFFVRGPRTAQQLNISPELAIGDSAILLRTVVDGRRRIPEVVSFMPHWESINWGNWEYVCELAGVNLINPQRPVNEIIDELLRSRLVITEAMHGAIVADALRVPWVPLLPINAVHRSKWLDWADALGITLQQHRLWPSSITELHLSRYVGVNSRICRLLEMVSCHLSACSLVKIMKNSGNLSADSAIDHATNKMLEKVEQLRRKYS